MQVSSQISAQPAASRIAQRAAERLDTLRSERQEAPAEAAAGRPAAAETRAREDTARQSQRVEAPTSGGAVEKVRENAVASEAATKARVAEDRAAAREQQLDQAAGDSDNTARKEQDALRRARTQAAIIDKKQDDQETRDTLARQSREVLAEEARTAAASPSDRSSVEIFA